jgi:hypothetical protein
MSREPKLPGLGRAPAQYGADAVRLLNSLVEAVVSIARGQQALRTAVDGAANQAAPAGTGGLTSDSVLTLLKGRITEEHLAESLASQIGRRWRTNRPCPMRSRMWRTRRTSTRPG